MSILSKVSPEVSEKIKTIMRKYGGDYSQVLNETWHLLGSTRPAYHDTRVGRDITMTGKYKIPGIGEFTGTGTANDKGEGRRLAAGEMMVQMGLIDKVGPKPDPESPERIRQRNASRRRHKQAPERAVAQQSQKPRWRNRFDEVGAAAS